MIDAKQTLSPSSDETDLLMQDDASSDGNQYLTFQLQEEEYGLDILKVQEIKNYSRITPIPNTPAYIKGAMNLRGTVVPIVDLRQRFGMSVAEYNQYTVIIVVNIGSRVVGLIVDAVNDVLNISPDDMEGAPNLGADVDTSFISGLAKQKDRLITLLNIDSLVAVPSLTASPVESLAG